MSRSTLDIVWYVLSMDQSFLFIFEVESRIADVFIRLSNSAQGTPLRPAFLGLSLPVTLSLLPSFLSITSHEGNSTILDTCRNL